MSIKNGFTLIETLIGVGIMGGISAEVLRQTTESNQKDDVLNFVTDASNVIKAVDHRIAIDGYDPDLWSSNTWDSESEIVEGLIKKDLTSFYSSNCSDGEWKPANVSENKTKLIQCNLWKNRTDNGLDLSANMKKDSAGFINSFDLLISFKTQESFQDNFKNLKRAFMKLNTNEAQEIAGIHLTEFTAIDTDTPLTTSECVNNGLNCALKLSFERSGGNEYIRADGSNSMINENLTFIESKGSQAPMKCLRWKNEDRDGSGLWSLSAISDEEDCGIGIYKTTGGAVTVETVSDTGTFKNVVLDQTCKVYEWDSISKTVIESLTAPPSPCGMTNNGSEIYQTIENTRAKTGLFLSMKAANADIKIANIDKIITPLINVDVINVANELNVNGVAGFKSAVKFEGKTTFSNETMFNDKVDVFADLEVRGTVKGIVGDFDNINSSLDILNASRDDYESVKVDVEELVADKRERERIEAEALACEQKPTILFSSTRMYCSYRGTKYLNTYRNYYYNMSTKQCKYIETQSTSGACRSRPSTDSPDHGGGHDGKGGRH